VAGFGARIGSHFDNAAWGQFIVQGVFLLVGPLFFAATIYMMLGRTIRLAGGEDVSLIPARWYTRTFVTADVTTLIVQGLGTFCTKWFSIVDVLNFSFGGAHATPKPRSAPDITKTWFHEYELTSH
jgi:hypothetical protein